MAAPHTLPRAASLPNLGGLLPTPQTDSYRTEGLPGQETASHLRFTDLFEERERERKKFCLKRQKTSSPAKRLRGRLPCVVG